MLSESGLSSHEATVGIVGLLFPSMIRVSGLLFGGGGLLSGRSLPVETELTSPRNAQKLLTELLERKARSLRLEPL